MILPWAGLLLSLAGYWVVLIRHLQVEWALNPQYAYGYAVPFLCLYLVWQRLADSPPSSAPSTLNSQPSTTLAPSTLNSQPSTSLVLFLAATLLLLLLLYGFARCVEEANPDWRLVSWALSLSVVGITFGMIRMAAGQGTFARLALPVSFFLVAVPWLRPIEALVVRDLTAGNTALACELLNLAGITALRQGNVIEVATGIVGIDDACSGIRSFQATLMVGGFFGLLYRLRWPRLLSLVAAGAALAFLLNVLRTSVLCAVAAQRGIDSVHAWHDPLGIVVLLVAFASLWLLARFSGIRSQASGISSSPSPTPAPCPPTPVSCWLITRSLMTRLLSPVPRPPTPGSCLLTPVPCYLLLLSWFLGVEVATECWYRARERDRAPTPNWTLKWAPDMPGFTPVPISQSVHAQLRFNEGKSASWRDDAGLQWQLFYFRWLPGRSWTQLVGDHNPSICLPAAGRKLVSAANLDPMTINGIPLLVRAYTFLEEGRTLYVFYAVWEDGAPQQHYLREHVSPRDRFDAFLEGRRNHGMRVIEAALAGASDPVQAATAFQSQLSRLLHETASP